jgi:hypothetical protein
MFESIAEENAVNVRKENICAYKSSVYGISDVLIHQ